MTDQQLNLDRLVPNQYPGLVALEPEKDGSASLYFRQGDQVESRTVAFHPWLLVSSRELAETIPESLEIVPLHGPGIFDHKVVFPNLDAYQKAGQFLKRQSGRNSGAADAPYRMFNDLSQQALTALSARLFRGLTFPQIRRLQLDIETYTTAGFDFSNPKREGDSIIMIALRDSTGWEKLLAAPELDEPTMLRTMISLIQERDPDVIEGHNIFNFDLPYIEERCRRHRIRLQLGRDRSVARSRSSRFTAAERASTFTRYDIHGRHVVDTMHLAQLYDIVHRSLDSYGLKSVARHFSVAAADRTYVRGENIAATFDRDPDTLKAYALDDVRETEAVADILSPSYFYQAQLAPFSYQNCVTRGNAARIDAMLCAAYLNGNYALPRPEPARNFAGGLTESLRTGIFHNVWHVDIRSLYPSIILSRKLQPARDHQQVFTSMLAELRRFRLLAKDTARQADTPSLRDHYNALQSSFKILINSFYGYLGYAQATFNDFDMAEEITRTGRQLLRDMVDCLEQQGAQVIEIDTDGIYFTPPPDTDDTAALAASLQSTLPEGIEVDLDATYRAMLGYKSKNYALLEDDGSLVITGAALKSRGLEPFQRHYIRSLVELLLKGQLEKVPKLFRQYHEAIENHRMPLPDLAKRENLSTPPRVYREKLATGQGRRSAAYELALKSPREYRQGDQVAFYITGNKKNISVTEGARLLQDNDGSRDENIPYYLDKLSKLHQKFSHFLPDSDPRQNLFQE